MQITSGRIPGAIKTVLYGPEGIGKTTFASRFPAPLFIDTEGSTVHMDVRRLPKPESWLELLGEVDWVYANPAGIGTLVIDTADWAEKLCIEHVCASKQVDGLESFAYGKGYVYAMEEFGHLLDKLENIRKKGIQVLIIAHAQMRKFEQPDELGAYDRWELKLSKKIAPMVKEWSDMLIFANYKTIVVNVDGKGAAKGRNKVQGGKRVMYTSHHPCWDAKNRFGLPEETDLNFDGIRAVIEGTGAAQTSPAAPTAPNRDVGVDAAAAEATGVAHQDMSSSGLARRVEAAAQTAQKPVEGPSEYPKHDAANPSTAAMDAPQAANAANTGPEYAGIPEALARMMREAQVLPDEVRYVIAKRGIYPAQTPWSVICADTQFMNGWLLHPAVWPKVVEMAIANRDEDPF